MSIVLVVLALLAFLFFFRGGLKPIAGGGARRPRVRQARRPALRPKGRGKRVRRGRKK